MVDIFKSLHQDPELAFSEFNTSRIVKDELMSLGYKVLSSLGKTGVVGVLENGKGPVIMYRADMDCNAVTETTGLPYASKKMVKREDGSMVPVMHACGHDTHVTWLLGVAKAMKENRQVWKGTLLLVAQPAEEILKGAQSMVDDGMYDKGVPVPDFLFGMHTWPLALGTIQNGSGVQFAGSDQLDVVFWGKGGHGASPELAIDPIVMASNAVLQYQTIVSRNIGAQEAAVLTVGSFVSGNSNNIIPASAMLRLNLRWFNQKVRQTLLDGIKRINEGIAKANGLPAESYPSIDLKSSVSPLINDLGLQQRINKALLDRLPGLSIISNSPPVMVSEDFHNLVSKTPGTPYDYIFIGVADPVRVEAAKAAGRVYPYYNHNGDYQVDLRAITLGCMVAFTALLELFKK